MPPEVKAADQALLKDQVFSFFGAQRYFEDFGEEYLFRIWRAARPGEDA